MEARHPDAVVDSGRFEVDPVEVEAELVDDVQVSVMPVAEAADPDRHLPRHQGAAVEHRVARLDQPGLRAQPLHVPAQLHHDAELVEGAGRKRRGSSSRASPSVPSCRPGGDGSEPWRCR